METLRIAQVAHAFPPYVGGLSHVCENLSKGLRDLGHEVEVITLDPSGTLAARDTLDGISVRRFPCLAPAGAYFLPTPRILPHLRSRHVDVVHAHNLGALLVPVAYAAARSGPGGAFVVSPHHHEAGSLWHTRLLWRPYRPLVRRVLRGSDRVHCVSAFEAEAVAREFGVAPVVVPNGVAEDVHRFRWRPPRDRIVLTFAGRVEPYKRVETLVRACALLAADGRPVAARVIGEGTALRAAEALADRLHVPWEAHGFAPREEYLQLLSTSTCVVNPSKFEAFSLVVAEALGMGVPVVAALPWGRTFEGHGGVRLVDGGSPPAVAEAVRELLEAEPTNGWRMPTWAEVARRIVSEVYSPREGRREPLPLAISRSA